MRRRHDETVKEYLSDHSTAKSFFKEYLAGNAGSLPENELNESVSQLFEEGGDSMATLAEKWKKEGKREAKWELVKNSLEVGLPIQTIEQITGLPLEEINRFKEKLVQPG
jgi:predicted transposase/invertase (TIGR01784 family)